jgi:class 3 adenylate cyclase/tetratricopeptide (TPR) repeat protein
LTEPGATEREQIEAGLAALEAQRNILGDAVLAIAAAPLRTRLEALIAQASAAEQQRRLVSVMFVDMVGSTALSRELDAEDVHAVLDTAMQRFTAVIGSFGGRVLQYTGDGLLAAFGAGETREDDAERAVRAGLDILAAARDASRQAQRDLGIEGYAVRIGIATGPVLLGGGVDAEGSIRGATVNLAARMEQAAPPGGLRIHHDTLVHVRGVFRVCEEPPLPVKGLDEPARTYLVQGVRPRAFRSSRRGIDGVETRMVAREVDLERLQDCLRSVAEQRRSVFVSIVGDAGLGKSRLLHEFEQWADTQAQGLVVLRGRADPSTRSQPFGLLHNVLAWHLQIADDDDAATARRKLEDGLAPQFGPDGQAHAHLLGQVLGLDFADSPHLRGIVDDARQIRNGAFHAVELLLRRMSELHGAPLLLLLDDLQWADDGTLDLIQYLESVHGDLQMLAVWAQRPGLHERRPEWAALDARREHIELQPLDRRACRELTSELLKKLGHVPVALRELLIGGAEGNPFHMEELLRMLIDAGAILVGEDRWQLLPERLLAAHVPPTLTGVLQARLDSLPATERHALQQAAVIGFVFWDQALAALDPDAVPALAGLVQRGLLVPHEQGTFEGQKEYAFKHQALHQVTYDSLLRRQRRDSHARVAAWLAAMRAGRATETLGLAAGHFERAGDVLQACRYYTRAAEDAAARYANQAMLDFVQRALALLPDGEPDLCWRLLSVRERHLRESDDRAAHAADLNRLAGLAEQLDNDARRDDVALRRASTLRSAGDHAAAEVVLRRRLDAAPPGATASLALLPSLADTLIGQGRYAQAQAVIEQGLPLARAHADRTAEDALINAAGLIAMEQGDLTVAVTHFEAGLAIVREIDDPAKQGLHLNNLGATYLMLGDYARARRHLDEGLRLARRIGSRPTEASLLLNTASVAHLQGDDTGALALAQAAHDAAVASSQRDLAAFALLVKGHAQHGLGRLQAARDAYAASRDALMATTLRSHQVLDPVSGLARVALADGQLHEALQLVQPLLDHLQAGGRFEGTEEPLRLPLTCYQVLAAAGDPRADKVLRQAHDDLQAKAARISDPQARQGFLQQVPHHRAILALWQGRRRADSSFAASEH